MCGSDSSNSGCDIVLPAYEGGHYGGKGGSGAHAFGGSGGSAAFGGTNGLVCRPDAGVRYRVSGTTCVADGCVTGFADCNQDLATDGCETSLSNSVNDCGLCGHACDDTSCTLGSCFSAELIGGSGQDDVSALAVSDGTIYYALAGVQPRVMFITQAGSTAMLYSASTPIREIIARGNHVAVAEIEPSTQIRVFDLAKGLAVDGTWSDSDAFEALALDDTWLYFTTSKPLSASIDAGAEMPEAQNDTSTDLSLAGAGGVSGSAGSATLGDNELGETASSDAAIATLYEGSVYRAPLSGGPKSLVAAAPGRPRAIAVSNGMLYVAWSNPSRLVAITTNDSSESVLATGNFDASRIAIAPGYVYFADQLAVCVSRVPIDGGPIEQLLTTPDVPYDVRIDGSDLWFTARDPALLYRQASPEPALIAGLLRAETVIALDPAFVYWSSPKVGLLRAPIH